MQLHLHKWKLITRRARAREIIGAPRSMASLLHLRNAVQRPRDILFLEINVREIYVYIPEQQKHASG